MRYLFLLTSISFTLASVPAVIAQSVDSVVMGAPEPPPSINLVEARKGARQYAFPPCITCANIPEIQRELTRLGYQAGPIDGIVGPRTRAAIKAFQRDHGLPVDGRATADLLTELTSR